MCIRDRCNEDLALMRVIPGMTVIQPCDEEETKQAIRAVANIDGPCYVRLGRGKVESVYDLSLIHIYCHAIVYADLLFLSIYPQDFPEAIAYVKEIFKMRAKTNPNQKLSMLCLTNKNGMIPMIQDAFVKDMNEELLSWFMHQVVIRDTIIRRSTDADDHRSLNIRSTAVLSLLIQPPLTIDIADIEWLELCDDIAMLKAVSYTHLKKANC